MPLPPIPTPIAKLHQSGVTFTPCDSKPRSMGTIAAVKGILSIKADNIAAAHINTIGAFKPEMIEVPIDVVSASTIVVDQFEGAFDEAGEIIRL